jgi:hypothetical protein
LESERKYYHKVYSVIWSWLSSLKTGIFEKVVNFLPSSSFLPFPRFHFPSSSFGLIIAIPLLQPFPLFLVNNFSKDFYILEDIKYIVAYRPVAKRRLCKQ